MSRDRYEALVGALLEDGRLSPDESEELASLLKADGALRDDLRRQLILWDLCAQQHAPERTAESFVAACHTRLRASGEPEDAAFLDALRHRLATPKRPAGVIRRWIRGPLALAWAAPLAAAVLAIVLWLGAPREAVATTLHGEAICTACMLHESHEHRPVLRYHDGAEEKLCYLECELAVAHAIGNYCAGPVPIDATGGLRREEGRLVLAVQALARLETPKSAEPAADAEGPPRLSF